jgi:hypothetical protein
MKNLAYELLKNESAAREYLIKKYPRAEAKQLAYRNVHAFTSYIKQGTALFDTAKNSDFWSCALLIYYGMMSLLKAFSLSIDPNYPHSTSLLQHGLTSPKRKKEPYRFFHDEVRVQKDGFFPYLCQLFSHPVATGERLKLEVLCSFIPDLHPLFRSLHQKTYWWEVVYENGKLTCPLALADELCISVDSFVQRLNRKSSTLYFSSLSMSHDHLTLVVNEPENILQHPWLKRSGQKTFYLWNFSHSDVDPFPEILAYYALFFSLSMLSRYDPPVWHELHSDIEKQQLMIQTLIDVAPQKFPDLLYPFF